MRPAVWLAAPSGLALLASACGVDPYACAARAQCVRGTLVGQCEPEGYCSYPDDDCDSGSRFSVNADDEHAGRCVSADVADGPDDGSDDAPDDGSDGSDGFTPPGCGDGTLDADEECDDGNRTDGDGCSAQCRAAGSVRWTWNGAASTTLTGLAVGSEGRVYLCGDDDAQPDGASFALALAADGSEAWPATLLAAEGLQRRSGGIAAGEQLLVAGTDFGGPAGSRAWAAWLDLDGGLLDLEVDDTSGEEGWQAVVPAALDVGVLVGTRDDLGLVRWPGDPAVEITTEAWVATAGRGDGSVGLLGTGPVSILGRGGQPTVTGTVEGTPRAAAFAPGGDLLVAGSRDGAPWLARVSVDGSVGAQWMGMGSGAAIAVTSLGPDAVIATDSGTLARIAPDGTQRWDAPAPPTGAPSTLASTEDALLLGGSASGMAWVVSIVP